MWKVLPCAKDSFCVIINHYSSVVFKKCYNWYLPWRLTGIECIAEHWSTYSLYVWMMTPQSLAHCIMVPNKCDVSIRKKDAISLVNISRSIVLKIAFITRNDMFYLLIKLLTQQRKIIWLKQNPWLIEILIHKLVTMHLCLSQACD